MRSIGIRALRQQASQYLRDVQRGETIQVTDRGHPIARLVPVPSVKGVEELAASGRAILARGDALTLGSPLAPLEGKASPSKALAESRADER